MPVMRPLAVLLLGALVLAGCGSGSGGKEGATAQQPAADLAPVAPTSAQAVPTTPEIIPTVPPTPKPTKSKNPLASESNKTACDKARRDVSKKAHVFQDVANQTATISDLGDAATSLQGSFKDIASFAEGGIYAQAVALQSAYGHMRVAVDTSDSALLGQGVKEQTAALPKLTALCDSIGH